MRIEGAVVFRASIGYKTDFSIFTQPDVSDTSPILVEIIGI